MRYFFFSNDGKLGDAALNTALVEGIQRNDSDSQIYVATSGSTTAFWENDPRIKEVVTLHKAGYRQYARAALKHSGFDYLIFLRSLKNEKLLLFRVLSRPKNVVVSPTRIGRPAIERVEVALRAIFKTDVRPRPVIQRRSVFEFPAGLLPTSYIVLNAFSSGPRKTLSVPRGQQLLKSLANGTDLDFVVIGQVKDAASLHEMLAAVHDRQRFRAFVFDETKGVEQLIALCRLARMVLSVDSAPVHVASAFNVPTINIIWPGPKSVTWGPMADLRTSILSRRVDHLDEFDDQEVVRAVEQLLQTPAAQADAITAQGQ